MRIPGGVTGRRTEHNSFLDGHRGIEAVLCKPRVMMSVWRQSAILTLERGVKKTSHPLRSISGGDGKLNIVSTKIRPVSRNSLLKLRTWARWERGWVYGFYT